MIARVSDRMTMTLMMKLYFSTFGKRMLHSEQGSWVPCILGGTQLHVLDRMTIKVIAMHADLLVSSRGRLMDKMGHCFLLLW